MPWVCNDCQAEVRADDQACPECQAPKTHWTMVAERTRTLVLSAGRRFHLLRGTGAGAIETAPLEDAEVAPALPKAEVRALSAEGRRPAARDVLVVRLLPRKARDLTVTLALKHARRPVVERGFPRDRPADLADDGHLDVPFLLAYGEGSLDGVTVPGVEVVDVSEDGEPGHAPTLEAAALGKRPREVPIEAERRRGYLLEMEDVQFHHGSAVLLPDRPDDADAAGDPERLDGLAALRVGLEWAGHHPDQRLLVAGHTDTTGSDAVNLVLSRRRGRVVHALLVGERAAWVEECEAANGTEDVQRVLRWAAAAFGWGCDPGPVDGAAGPKTRRGVEAFQGAYNDAHAPAIAVDGVVGPETWGAVFDCYEAALDRALEAAGGLAERRAGLRFLEPAAVGCGEHHPIEAARRDDYRSATNRRVELLFFDPGEEPELACHRGEACTPDVCPLYAAGRYALERVPARVTGYLRLRVGRRPGWELEGRPYEVVVGGEVHSGTVAAGGVITVAVPSDTSEARVTVFPYGREGTPWTWPLRVRPLAPLESSEGLQQRLNNLGHEAGRVDGDLGPRARTAVRSFQRREALRIDGDPGAVTRERLGQVYGG